MPSPAGQASEIARLKREPDRTRVERDVLKEAIGIFAEAYRTGGQQKVTVEHVTVNAGGQAIVGNVAKGGRVEDGN